MLVRSYCIIHGRANCYSENYISEGVYRNAKSIIFDPIYNRRPFETDVLELTFGLALFGVEVIRCMIYESRDRIIRGENGIIRSSNGICMV